MHKLAKTAFALATAGVLATTAACGSSGSDTTDTPANTVPATTSESSVSTPPSTSTSASPTPAADVPSLTGVSTSVKLDAKFAQALQTLKVTPGLIGTAKLNSKTGTLTFPITGGHVTVYKKGEVTPYVQGEIDHDGSGFTLSAGGIKVGLQNFVVDPGNNSKLTGEVLVNGKVAVKSAKLFDLNGNTLKPITVSDKGIATLTGTQVLLSDDAAALLNQTFKINALKGGLLIGIATLLVNVAS